MKPAAPVTRIGFYSRHRHRSATAHAVVRAIELRLDVEHRRPARLEQLAISGQPPATYSLVRDREDDGVGRLRACPVGVSVNAIFVLRLVRQRQRIVHLHVECRTSAARCTMSMTFELRMSGTFSLNVMPSTVTTDRLAGAALRQRCARIRGRRARPCRH